MKRTRNEVYRLCQKAARGAGAPAGLEFDTARAAAWLSARGLPGLKSLTRDLSALPRDSDCHLSQTAADGAIDASGKPGVLIASLLVDRMLAERAENTEGVRVKHLSSPLYLVPAAAGYASKGWHFDFSLRSVDGEAFRITLEPAAGVSIKTSSGSRLAALADKAFDVAARCASSADATDFESSDEETLLLDENALTRARDESLACGVEVDDQSWKQLSQYALKALVPPSEKSRSGAGAVASDNE